jgi:hypothetical protein
MQPRLIIARREPLPLGSVLRLEPLVRASTGKSAT